MNAYIQKAITLINELAHICGTERKVEELTSLVIKHKRNEYVLECASTMKNKKRWIVGKLEMQIRIKLAEIIDWSNDKGKGKKAAEVMILLGYISYSKKKDRWEHFIENELKKRKKYIIKITSFSFNPRNMQKRTSSNTSAIPIDETISIKKRSLQNMSTDVSFVTKPCNLTPNQTTTLLRYSIPIAYPNSDVQTPFPEIDSNLLIKSNSQYSCSTHTGSHSDIAVPAYHQPCNDVINKHLSQYSSQDKFSSHCMVSKKRHKKLNCGYSSQELKGIPHEPDIENDQRIIPPSKHSIITRDGTTSHKLNVNGHNVIVMESDHSNNDLSSFDNNQTQFAERKQLVNSTTDIQLDLPNKPKENMKKDDDDASVNNDQFHNSSVFLNPFSARMNYSNEQDFLFFTFPYSVD